MAGTGTIAAAQAGAAAPERYTIEFTADGNVTVLADCRTVTGRYAIRLPLEMTITLSAPPATGCDDPSLDRAYLDALARVGSFSIDDGELRLFFTDGAGGMRFKSQGWSAERPTARLRSSAAMPSGARRPSS